MNEPIDAMGPWTIKSVATSTKDAIIKASRQEGLTVGQWLERRVGEWVADGSPVPVSSQVANLTTPDLTQATRAVADLADAVRSFMSVSPDLKEDPLVKAMRLNLSRALVATRLAPKPKKRGQPKSATPSALPAPEA